MCEKKNNLLRYVKLIFKALFYAFFVVVFLNYIYVHTLFYFENDFKRNCGDK